MYKVSNVKNRIIQIISTVSIIIILVSVTAFIYFIYCHFYQIINRTRNILILQSEISLTQVDLHGYQIIIDYIDSQKQKSSIIKFEQLRDPFTPFLSI